MAEQAWYGVDLDGTLAHYTGWRGAGHIGAPVPAMVERVRQWIASGYEVRIFTARVSSDGSEARDADARLARGVIDRWSLEHIGRILPITNQKDYNMLELWDDRCVRVEMNTGRVIGEGTCTKTQSGTTRRVAGTGRAKTK